MKTVIVGVVSVVFALVIGYGPAHAITYYCLPLDKSPKSYVCKEVDFEIREFPSDLSCAKGLCSYVPPVKHRCVSKGDKIECTPFPKDAFLLETPHTYKDNTATFSFGVLDNPVKF